MLNVVSALHNVPLFMDKICLLLVPVDTEVDLQPGPDLTNAKP